MCTETSASLDYWFRVMDLDSDGFVSLADFHAFHMDTVVFLIQVSQPSCRGGAKLLKIVVVPNGFSYCLLKIKEILGSCSVLKRFLSLWGITEAVGLRVLEVLKVRT